MFRRLPNLKQIKYLGRILTKKEKKYIASLLLLMLFSLFFLIGRIYFPKLKTEPAPGGKYIEGLVGVPKVINPILAVDDVDLTLVRLTFSGLLKYDKNLELKPDLAETVTVSDDQKKYTFCLKQNLFWHDGEALTLNDVIFTFEIIKNQVFKNSSLERLRRANFSKIDDNCLEFNLEKSSSTFSSDLTLGILPKHIWSQIDPEDFPQSEFNLKPVGSGPFKFDSLARDDANQIKFYTLKRNEKYFQPPYLEEIIFKFYPDPETATEALKINQIDGLVSVPKENDEELNQNKKLKYYQINLPYYTAVFFDLRDKENKKTSPLQEKAVRQALTYLTPKKQIFKSVFNQKGTIIYGPILSQSFAFDPNIQKYDYNPELAEDIFKQAGWERKENGFLEKNGEMLEIRLTTANQPDLLNAATLIQKSWQEAGVKIKFITIPFEQIREIIIKRNFDAFLYGVLENTNSDPYPLWHSSQIEPPGLNLTGFKDRRVDELLEKAALTDDKEEKKTYYRKFQELIVQNLPAIFLYSPTYVYLVNQKIKGIDIDQLNHPEDRFINIEGWYIKTKKQFNN